MKRIFGDGWFTSPSQQKELDEAYFKKMFPFKDEQRIWENETLKYFFDNDDKINAIKYASYVLREMLIDDKYNEDEFLKVIKFSRLNNEEKHFIECFTKLEFEATSISELPGVEKIKEVINND